jgi:hypothetical protein
MIEPCLLNTLHLTLEHSKAKDSGPLNDWEWHLYIIFWEQLRKENEEEKVNEWEKKIEEEEKNTLDH